MFIETGFIKDTDGKILFEKPSFIRGSCDCMIFSFFCFYFTILSKQCSKQRGYDE